MSIRYFLTGCLFAIMIGVFSVSAAADTEAVNPMLTKKYSVWIGGFFPDIDSTASINGEVIENPPELSFEEILGLDDSKSVLWGGASWRISRRNYLEFEFANLNRDARTELITDDPIKIGDSIVDAGVRIDTTFDLTLARLTYGYSVVRNEKMDVQLKAGAHIADTAASIKLGAGVRVCRPGDDPDAAPGDPGSCPVFTDSTDRLESSDVTLPLPHFGASFAYAFTPNLGLRSQALGFALKINDIKGSIIEIDADLVYHPWNNFGLGAGFRYFKVKVESTGSSLNGKFDFEYYGPVAYAVFTF
ncbi:MAG: hypothetical protein DRP64_04735 [Verrucomicrobia bacterium]|nr:MAG: hypothetical protein DRP64_04735 [Verrucomicrobiota bacterium]